MPKLHRPEELQLSNGIPVILQHYEGAVAATYWWVQTGSADESPTETGFAHFLEHMLFKDTSAKETGRASTGQVARAIESFGGEINAYTSFDQTVYHVTCAATHWEKVIDAFGTMAKPQKFLKSDFEREREVILEELRKNQDSPSRALFQGLFTATFKKHPYGRPVIGFEKILKEAKVGQLEAFYKRNYVSQRMGLIVVGPIDNDRKKGILKLLEKHYGGNVIPKRSGERRPRPAEPEFRKKPELVKKAFDVKTPTATFAFRVPSLTHPDVPALDLAANVLSMGELSRLYQSMFYGASVATDVSGGMYVPNDPGMLYFQGEYENLDKMKQGTEVLLKELSRLCTDGPTEEEMGRVLVAAESERLYATQTADGMAGRLGFLRFVLGDLDFDQRYLEDLREVDRDKIQEVAKRYFDTRRMSGTLLLPKGDLGYDLKPIEEMISKYIGTSVDVPISKKFPKKTAKSIHPAKRLLGPPPELIVLPSGLKVIYRENTSSHVMSVHAAALGGLRLELGDALENAESDWGTSYMMSLTWAKGTASRDSQAIARIVEGSAAGLDGFGGRNTVGIQMTGLARDWSKLSNLFGEVLAEPSFPEDEVQHSRRVAEDAVRGIEDHTSQLCSKLFLETLFEKHPYGRLTVGSLESLAGIGSAKLKAYHQAWVRPNRLVLTVSGAVKRSELDRWIAEVDQRLAKASRKTTRSIPEKLTAEPALKAPRWVEKNLGREQVHILIGGLGTTIHAEDRHALQLLQTLLGGQSGRLFIEIREKKSLAYTVSPVSFDGIESGYVGTYIASAPQKRTEALDGIRKVYEQLAAKGPTPAEMKRAKEFFLGRRAMDLQSDSSLATHYGLEAVYGLPILNDQQIIDRVEALSANDLKEVCRKYLLDQPMVTSVVG